MRSGVFGAISEWSQGQLAPGDLEQVLTGSRADIEGHRKDFGQVVEGLEPGQARSCQPLTEYAFSLLDLMDWELSEALQALRAGDRGRVIRAGDQMARASFQLNQTFVQFSQQALRALGPTEVPNLNHLLALRNDYLEHPDPALAAQLRDALDEERVISTRALHDLKREPELPEVATLKRAFTDHLVALEAVRSKLSAPLADNSLDLSGIAGLEKTFLEISSLLPIVQMKLRGHGETKYPDLNLLLKLLDDLESGRVGDMPVMDALESLESSFSGTAKKCELAAAAETSVLIAQEIRATLETFELFAEGLDAVYRFLDERDLRWLDEGRRLLREFAGRFLGHQERLEVLREQQNKVLCPYCSHFNEIGPPRCQRCAKPLPLNLGVPEDSTFTFVEQGPARPEEKLLVTSNLVPVYQAAKAIDEASMDAATFLATLDRFEATLESGVDRIPAEPRSGDLGKVEQLYSLLDEGLAELFAGLDLMRGYPESLDQNLLLEGIRKLDSGAKKVTQAGAEATRGGRPG